MSTSTQQHPSVGLWLRAEHVAVLIAAVAIYARVSGDWLAFALLLFVPDISMIGYLRGPKIGSIVYNAGHLLTAAIALVGLGIATDSLPIVQIGLIWTAHITLDRAIGYGFKYPTHFKDTHLQRV